MLEQKVLYHLTKDIKNYTIITDRKITNKYFSNDFTQKLFNIFMGFYYKYSTVITSNELEEIIKKSKYDNTLKQNLISFYYEISSVHDESNFIFLIDELSDTYKLNTFKNILIKSTDSLKNGDTKILTADFKACLNSIENINIKKHESLANNTTDMRYNNFLHAGVSQNKKAILTGFKTIDTVTGGIFPEELWVIEGWAKSGKSIFLLNMAYNAWLAGKNVLYVSAEMSDMMVLRRFDALGAGISSKGLKFGSLNDEELAKYQKFLEYTKSCANVFNVIYEPACLISNINQKVKEMKDAGKLDLIVVDYLGICTPSTKGNNRYEEIGHLAWELKNIAGYENIPVITAHQSSREGKKSGKSGSEYVSESIKILQHCDLFASIRTVNEVEKRLHNKYELETTLLLSRDSEECMFTCDVYKDRMLIVEKNEGGYEASSSN